MLQKTGLKLLLASIVLGLASHSALALTTEEKGLEISREAIKRDTGWADNTADMMMYLRNKQGQESIRELKIKTLEQKTDGDKSLTLFKKPGDVKGTAFLSFSHAIEADDQWLYMPALKRVKRISIGA